MRHGPVISVAVHSMSIHRDFEMCKRSVVAADVLSHMPSIWCVDDRAM